MKRYLALLACVGLVGCASSPTALNLVPSGISRAPAPFDLEVKTITVVAADKSEQTGEVKMDPTYGTLWRDALQTAIDEAGLFKDDATRKVTIKVLVRKFSFNPTGLSNSVSIDADYSIVDRSNGNQIYLAKTETAASMDSSEEWVARQRVIKIFNKATQESITRFVNGLRDAKMP